MCSGRLFAGGGPEGTVGGLFGGSGSEATFSSAAEFGKAEGEGVGRRCLLLFWGLLRKGGPGRLVDEVAVSGGNVSPHCEKKDMFYMSII